MKSVLLIARAEQEKMWQVECCFKPIIEHMIDVCKQACMDHIYLLSDEGVDFDGVECIPADEFTLDRLTRDGEIFVLRGNMPLLSCDIFNENTGIFCFKNDGSIDKETIFDHLIELEDEVNDYVSLACVEAKMRHLINQHHLSNGVHLIDPATTYIGSDVRIDDGVVIYPNVVLKGTTQIGAGSVVTSGSYLENALIHENVVIESSKIIDSEVKDGVTIGPYSHLRGHSCVEAKVRIGNFVEFKNTHFGEGSKCAHLTYIGDSDVGKGVNIGCGVVTVNYDGKHKFRTTIKDGAFIGSNVNLIAPVTIGEKALLAAGSTITEDVEDGAMGIARSRQSNKEDFGKKYLTK